MTMVALYVSVVSFIILLFQYINVLFPDDLVRYYDPYSGAIRSAIASLFVFFPLYVGLTRVLNQDIRKNHEKRDIGIRKWLIFLTLFIAGVTILIDLVVLLNTFLSGEVTMRFILKVLAILIVFGSVFGYYICDLRGRWEKDRKMAQYVGIGAVVVVFATVIAGFFVIGSPQSAREIRLDQERVGDLQNIQWQVVKHWQTKKTLPESLADLEDPLSGYANPVDPETQTSYEYAVLGEMTFELCATFTRSSADIATYSPEKVIPMIGEENWDYEAGRYCFERTIDPERYPAFEKEIMPVVR